MRKISMIVWLGAILLAGCGGSSTSLKTGGTGTGTTPPPSTDPATTITVVSSSAQIAADGSNSATISATAKDAANNLVKEQP